MDEASVEQKRSNIFPFLELAAEVRNKIYSYTADMNDAVLQMAKHQEKVAHSSCGSKKSKQVPQRQPEPTITTTTPTVLLINRQIHQEAIGVIQCKTLLVDSVGYFSYGRSINLFEFLPQQSWASVRNVRFQLQDRVRSISEVRWWILLIHSFCEACLKKKEEEETVYFCIEFPRTQFGRRKVLNLEVSDATVSPSFKTGKDSIC